MEAIIPPVGSAIPAVMDYSHHRYGHNHCATSTEVRDYGLDNLNHTSRVGDVVGASVNRNADSIQATTTGFGFQNLNSTQRGFDNLGSGVERFGFANLGATERQGERGVATTADVGRWNAAKTDFYGYENAESNGQNRFDMANGFCDVKDKMASGFAADALASCQNTASIIQNQAGGFRDTLLQAATNTTAIQLGLTSNFKDQLIDSAKNAAAVALQNSNNTAAITLGQVVGFKDGEISAEKNAAALALAAEKNANALALQAQGNFKDVLMQASQNTAALQATANQLAAVAAAQLAECCCELKELVRAKGDETDDLIRDVENRRVAARLAETQQELSILRMRASLPPPLVGGVAV